CVDGVAQPTFHLRGSALELPQLGRANTDALELQGDGPFVGPGPERGFGRGHDHEPSDGPRLRDVERTLLVHGGAARADEREEEDPRKQGGREPFHRRGWIRNARAALRGSATSGIRRTFDAYRLTGVTNQRQWHFPRRRRTPSVRTSSMPGVSREW